MNKAVYLQKKYYFCNVKQSLQIHNLNSEHMKRFIWILFVPFFLQSCGESEKELQLQAQVDSLKQITGADSQTINEYLKAFNEIQANLDEIKDKEKIITSRASVEGELGESEVTAINEDITAIYDMMQENKDKLASLKKKLKNSDKKVAEFQKTVDKLTAEMTLKGQELESLRTLLEQKNVDIAVLNEKVESLETDVEVLETDKTEKEQTIAEQDKALNTAYSVVGNVKELETKGVITREGGFVGIGGVKKINQDVEGFATIDIRKVKEFDLRDAKSVKLLTTHPDAAYEFQMNGKNYSKLVIKDHEKFWKGSKYLVVTIK